MKPAGNPRRVFNADFKMTIRGFTTVELVAAVVIIVAMAAIAIPSVVRSWTGYRLSGVAADVANILQRTRYDAIRLNTTLECCIRPQGNAWTMWVDENKNGAWDATEPMLLLPQQAELLPAGVAPPPASMGFPNAQVPAGAIAFDSRGTVNFSNPAPRCAIAIGGAPAVYALYLGVPRQPTYGYRAVTVVPAGKTKVWSATSGSGWHSP